MMRKELHYTGTAADVFVDVWLISSKSLWFDNLFIYSRGGNTTILDSGVFNVLQHLCAFLAVSLQLKREKILHMKYMNSVLIA